MKKLLLLLLTLPFVAFCQPLSRSAQTHNLLIDYDDYFREAYQQYPALPKGILEAVAYGNTRIHHIQHSANELGSCTGLPEVYGVMGLTLDGKGYFKSNLTQVANLSGISVSEIIDSPEKNILAYASAFNSIMGMLDAQRGPETKDDEIVFNTLIELSELPYDNEGQIFALNTQLYSYFWFMQQAQFQATYNFPNHNFDVYSLFGEENYRVLSSEQVIVSDNGISDNYGNSYRSGGFVTPSVQSSDYSPAIWTAAASCNYSSRSAAVTAVVIHDIEGSYASCISWFQNCNAHVSAHYVVRSSDGQITQMVLESKKAWHVGSENGYTIGIEHEGYQAQTGWYTNAMYQSSAALVRDICNSGYGINKTTCYNGAACNGTCVKPSTFKIKGHQMYPNQTHNDPGPHWDWSLYYSLINNTSSSCGTPSGLNVSSLTSSSATLNWTAVSGATSYNITYTSSNGTVNTTSTTNSASITGLTPSTTYQFSVQAVCSSAGSFSPNSSFTTQSTSITNDNCSNATSIFPNPTCNAVTGDIAGATVSGLAKASCDVFSGAGVLHDVWYQFQATATSHSIKVSPSAHFDAVAALYTSCSGGQIGCSDNGGGQGGVETISATGLTIGNTYYVRVYSYGSSVPSTTTFDICVVGPTSPSCGIPANLNTSGVDSTNATLTWGSVSGAVSYNVQYKPTSSSAWVSLSTSSTSASISGLSTGTSYEFQVQAVCTNAGNFSSSKYFTTTSNTPNTSNTLTIGTSTTPYSAHPYGTVYMDERVQYIIPKSELVTAGWTSANPYLKSISFYVSSASPQSMGNFTIKISHTTGTSFTSTSFLSGSNSVDVYTGTVTANQGWNTYTFTTPFHYNGTSSLLVSICWNNSSFTVNSSVYATSYSSYVALYKRQDVSNGGVCSSSTGSRSYYRPNTKLAFSSSSTLGNPQGLVVNPGSGNQQPNVRNFTIYPNPLDGNILSGIIDGGEDQALTIHIYDLLGREVLNQDIEVSGGNFSVILDRDRFQTGVYTIIGITSTEQFSKKLVIK